MTGGRLRSIPCVGRRCARRTLIGAIVLATVAGCAAHDATRADDDDPMRVRGSVTVGPVVGSPGGPYSPRP